MVTANGAGAILDGTGYRFVSVIARGRMSTVVEAVRLADGSPVVIKLLPEELEELAELVPRLRLEAEALSRLPHENLVRVLEFGTTALGVPFLVMERLVGRTLQHELEARGGLPESEALELIGQVLRGLGAAHAVGIVHRDVKPANLFICDGTTPRTVKVLDFGIAKALGEAELSGLTQPKTREGVRLGTPRFIAPEQVRGGVVTAATDVYAAGLVLYQMISGRHPFAATRSVDDLYRAQLSEMPPPPSAVCRAPVPEWLDRVVLRAIAKNPSDRFADATAFASALRQAESGPDSRSASTEIGDATAVTDPPPRPVSRRTEVVAVLVALLGAFDLLWRLGSALATLPHLVDPIASTRELWGAPAAGAEDRVAMLSRLGSISDIARSAVLGSASGALVLCALRALSRRTLDGLHAFTTWLFAAVAAAFLLDLLALGLRGALLTELVPREDGSEIALGVGYSLGVAATFVVPVVQMLLVLLLRRLSRQT